MAGELDKAKEMEESSDLPTKEKKDNETTSKKKQRGFLSRLWNGIFGLHSDNIEKRLQHISKEEATILARMRKRSQGWRRAARHLIVFCVILEVIAVAYAIMTTRSVVLNWKLRAFRVLPMFLLPVLSSIMYSGISRFIKMCDQKDQKSVEKLREERQSKIDELKEKTNYYITQQLIQRYDTDPAAKAAAAAVLASKLGAESGMKVYLGDEGELNLPSGKSNDVELVQSSGLRNRRSVPYKSHSTGSTMLQSLQEEEGLHHGEERGSEISSQSQLVVEHYSGKTKYNNGWIARIAALLVGEDPAQSYALICGNCHMHNGLARKEDYPYMTYYCPHCHALNKSKQEDGLSAPNSPKALNNNNLSSMGEPTPVSSLPEPAKASEEIVSEIEKDETIIDPPLDR
ncbi:uncharacterized protein At2g24330-like [Impatiens glandulifera]|uniref:uncharacterized protein At2g24330-like n=1 Tax=Impatiens glandulifera TaxID=253017 RepID=UPI001FB0A1FA|nr:uncharacterized protein At2g24330-like [Impatiens glandulifera]